MTKTLYIHIGTGKTGTTALQDFFALNSHDLEENDLVYIKTGRHLNKHRALDLNARRHDPNALNKVKDLLSLMNKEILSSKKTRFFISDEDFPGLTHDELLFYRDSISPDIKIKIIVYFRRQDEFLESWNNQLVKTGQYSSDIENLRVNLSKNGLLDYFEFIKTWESVFGFKNIHVRPYEKESFLNNSIYDDFLSIFDIVNDKFKIPIKNPNPSLTRDKILVLKKINNNGLKKIIDEKKLVNYIINIPSEIGDEKFVLPPEKRNEILLEYKKSNTSLAKRYLGEDCFFKNEFIDECWKPRTSVPDKLFIQIIKFLTSTKS